MISATVLIGVLQGEKFEFLALKFSHALLIVRYTAFISSFHQAVALLKDLVYFSVFV